MESTSLELKVMYAQDLKAFNFFQKLSVYALVSLLSDDPDKKIEQNQQQKTAADKEGDGNPEWKHDMRFDLKEVVFDDCDHVFIQFELKHEGGLLGDKTVGEVLAPIKDLIEESNGVVRFVNYEVRGTDGKPNGVLNFSYKMNNGKVNTEIGFNSPSFNISGFTPSQNQNPPEIHYPDLDFHNPTPEIHYPPPELPNPSQPPHFHYPPPPEGVYPPPAEVPNGIYPPPSSLPQGLAPPIQHHPPGVYPYPRLLPPPLPRPEMGDGGYCPPPNWPLQPQPQPQDDNYNYYYQDWRHHYSSSSWNGR